MPSEISRHLELWAAKVELVEACLRWVGLELEQEQEQVDLCLHSGELVGLEEVVCQECHLVVFLPIFRI